MNSQTQVHLVVFYCTLHRDVFRIYYISHCNIQQNATKYSCDCSFSIFVPVYHKGMSHVKIVTVYGLHGYHLHACRKKNITSYCYLSSKTDFFFPHIREMSSFGNNIPPVIDGWSNSLRDQRFGVSGFVPRWQRETFSFPYPSRPAMGPSQSAVQ
jgi:hypothetical protein